MMLQQDKNFTEEIEQIHAKITSFLQQGKKVCATSSFQTQSLPLLHILSRFPEKIPILFVDTGFHFAETYRFKEYVSSVFNLDVKKVISEVSKSTQIGSDGNLLYISNTENCCYINKVRPLEAELHKFDVWISGVRADQSATRNSFALEQPGKNGIWRYHPMLNWSSKDIYSYRSKFRLPENPLEKEGYLSVGCEPCTSKYLDDLEASRGGRWAGMKKDECGLHTDLAKD